MLQDLYEKLTFRTWHFGHFHVDVRLGKFFCHYDALQQLKDFESENLYDDSDNKEINQHQLVRNVEKESQ